MPHHTSPSTLETAHATLIHSLTQNPLVNAILVISEDGDYREQFYASDPAEAILRLVNNLDICLIEVHERTLNLRPARFLIVQDVEPEATIADFTENLFSSQLLRNAGLAYLLG